MILLLAFVVDEIWQCVLVKVSFGSCPWNVFRFIFVRSPVRFNTSASSFEISDVSQPGSSKATVDTTFEPLCTRRRTYGETANQRASCSPVGVVSDWRHLEDGRSQP